MQDDPPFENPFMNALYEFLRTNGAHRNAAANAEKIANLIVDHLLEGHAFVSSTELTFALREIAEANESTSTDPLTFMLETLARLLPRDDGRRFDTTMAAIKRVLVAALPRPTPPGRCERGGNRPRRDQRRRTASAPLPTATSTEVLRDMSQLSALVVGSATSLAGAMAAQSNALAASIAGYELATKSRYVRLTKDFDPESED